jgi:hypothetical protein
MILRRGADKSLARPGRKQPTATRLGIYSTYSPRSSVHLLARCSDFWKSLKGKKIRRYVQPDLRGSNDLYVGRKLATFQLFFSVQGTGGSPTLLSTLLKHRSRRSYRHFISMVGRKLWIIRTVCVTLRIFYTEHNLFRLLAVKIERIFDVSSYVRVCMYVCIYMCVWARVHGCM